jgi:hypothetical protein
MRKALARGDRGSSILKEREHLGGALTEASSKLWVVGNEIIQLNGDVGRRGRLGKGVAVEQLAKARRGGRSRAEGAHERLESTLR